MIRVLLVVLLLIGVSYARENPFFPAKGGKEMPYTSNKNRSLPGFNKATLSLPSQARVIQKVTVEYKCLDGSVEQKSIELQNSVDWHLPIVISQNYAIDVQDTKLQTGKNTQKTDINKRQKNFKKFAYFKYATFYSSGKKLKIITKDKIIRNFMLVNPHRIVIDFKRDTSLKTYTKHNKNTIFKKIKIGNHSGYYRVVIELDGQYRFKKRSLSHGYLFILN